MKQRLDNELVKRGLVATRSQAENYIKLGLVLVNGKVVKKPGYFESKNADIKLNQSKQYVSRAGLKLASAARPLNLIFKDKVVLDVGSSTGGFTDFVLQHDAKKVIAVDIGSKQLHPTLLNNPKIELHEQTDIRDFTPTQKPNIILIDVSFISLKKVLPHIAKIADKDTQIVTMLKPQFEARESAKHKGVIKNDTMRRKILKDFEDWVKKYFIIINKADSQILGAKGNQERFYLLSKIRR